AGGRRVGAVGRRRAPRLGLDRLALGIETRLRQLLCPLLGDHDVAALDGLVAALLQRIGPGLAGRPAAAGGVVLLAVAERGGQVRVGAAAHRHRARDVLAGAAVAVERHLGGRAQPAAELLVLGELARDGGIGDREVVAVTGAHAQRPIGARERGIRCRRGIAATTEQSVEEAARTAGGVLAVLRTAIV